MATEIEERDFKRTSVYIKSGTRKATLDEFGRWLKKNLGGGYFRNFLAWNGTSGWHIEFDYYEEKN